MKTINEKTKIIQLFDLYKNLLTPKQVDYFEKYYFYDESFKEISQELNVSKNAIFDAVKKIEQQLIKYEAKLNLLAHQQEKLALINALENNKISLSEFLAKIKDHNVW